MDMKPRGGESKQFKLTQTYKHIFPYMSKLHINELKLLRINISENKHTTISKIKALNDKSLFCIKVLISRVQSTLSNILEYSVSKFTFHSLSLDFFFLNLLLIKLCDYCGQTNRKAMGQLSSKAWLLSVL